MTNPVLTLARKVVCPILALHQVPLLKDVSWGGNFPGRHFLVIRRNEPQVGLCSFFLTMLGWIKYAFEHGMIPVVDLQTYRNIYLGRGERGRVNAWEFFFRQPGGFSLNAIRHAAKVTIATGVPPWKDFFPKMSAEALSEGNAQLMAWRKLVANCIRLNEEIAGLRNEPFEAVLRTGVIGVLARGTDYFWLKPHGHPVQPSAEQLIEKVKELGGAKSIYLVTEDGTISTAFKAAFSDRLVLSDQKPLRYDGGYLADSSEVKYSRERGIAYLKAVVDLARCPQIVAGRTSGTVATALLSKGFDSAYYFDLGVYP